MNSYWEQFKQTGAVSDYLNYIQSFAQNAEEENDAADNNGDSGARG